jgi:hypothetical protein
MMAPSMKAETQGNVTNSLAATVSDVAPDSIDDVEEREDLAQEDGRPLAQELHVVTNETDTTSAAQNDGPDVDPAGSSEENSEGALVTAEDAVSEETTTAIVHQINEIARQTVEEGQLKIGAFILQQVFDNDVDKLVEKNPNKDKSLRAICVHPDLLVDRRRLSTWVQAAALKALLIEHKFDPAPFTLSHLTALLVVKKREPRFQLAKLVSKHGWSARETRERALRMQSSRIARGNPMARRFMKALENPIKLINDEKTTGLFIDTEKLENDLDSGDRVDIIKAIDKTSKDMDKGKDILLGLKKSLLGIEFPQYK